MKPKLLICALAAVLSLGWNASAQTTGPNIVVNGDFETGSLLNWTQSGNTGDTFVQSGPFNPSHAGPYSGSYYLLAGPVTNPGFISQNLVTIPGTQYLLTYHLASDGYTPNQFEAIVGSTTLFNQTNVPQQGYTTYSYSYSATGSSTLLEFGFRDDPGLLSLDDISFVSLSLAGTPGLTPNQSAIAINLDFNTGGGSIAPIIATIATSSSFSQIAEDLNELSPQKLQILRSIAFDNFGFTANQLDNHLASLRYGGGGFDTSGLQVLDSSGSTTLSQIKSHLLAWNPAPNSAGVLSDVVDPVMAAAQPAADPNRWNTFIAGNVDLGNASGTADMPRASYTTGDVTAGADYRIDDHWAVGALFGFGHTSANTDSYGSKVRVDSYSPGVYATYAGHGWYANGLVAYNSNVYSESRMIPFLGTTASGSPHGNQISGNVDGGYEFKRGDWTFGPTLGVRYVNLDISGFTESGAGGADLDVNAQNVSSLRSELGGEFRYNWSWYGGKVIATPHVSAAWQHEYLDNNTGITSQFDGQGLGSFVVNTTSPERDSALIDLGLDTQWNDALDIFVDYQAQAGQSDFVGQSITAGFKISY
jgi:outer membrane autotransporter protein